MHIEDFYLCSFEDFFYCGVNVVPIRSCESGIDEEHCLIQFALSDSFQRMQFTIIGSISAIILVGVGSLLVWRLHACMHRGLFITGSLVLMLIAVVPALGLFVRIPDGSEEFSEIWLLGPTRKAEGYTFNVQINESNLIYVGVGNRLGSSAYYRVYMKLRNQTHPLPTASNSSPSMLPPLYEFDMFIRDDEVWEKPLDFIVSEALITNDTMLLKSLQANRFVFQVEGFSLWDKERLGFYYQLFFELWLYNMTSSNFQYHNCFVGLWLNVTNQGT